MTQTRVKPRTEAGRALLAQMRADVRYFIGGSEAAETGMVLAIEAEAARREVGLRAALLWALRNNGGECPADDPVGYVKAMRAALSEDSG